MQGYAIGALNCDDLTHLSCSLPTNLDSYLFADLLSWQNHGGERVKISSYFPKETKVLKISHDVSKCQSMPKCCTVPYVRGATLCANRSQPSIIQHHPALVGIPM